MIKKIEALIAPLVKQYIKRIREKQLKPGENGWGIPKTLPPYVAEVGYDKKRKVAVIGLGAQGVAHIIGFYDIAGIEIIGIADKNEERLLSVKKKFNFKDEVCFTDAEEMLKKISSEVELVTVATTAPFHIALGRLLLKYKIRKIILEKPLDNSLIESYKFIEEVNNSKCQVVVNYSRRWLLDNQAIKRALDKGYIGKIVSASVMVGRGELAMIGSHYFDAFNYYFDDEPKTVQAHLEPMVENRRGGDYNDPFGYCIFTYKSGKRLFIDFSSDYGSKNCQMIIKGEKGYIFVDEVNRYWSIYSDGQMVWTIPFSEMLKSSMMFTRVAAQILNSPENLSTIEESTKSMEMIFGAHISSQEGGRLVNLPLSIEEASLKIVFP